MTKRVLLISNMYPSKEDQSYGIFVRNFEESVMSSGLEIADKVVITGKGKSVVNKIKKYILFYAEIIYKGLTVKYDIVYAHYITHCALPLLILSLLSKKPIVLNAHGDDVVTTSKTQQLLQLLARPLVHRCTLIVVPSKYFMHKVSEIFRICKDKIFVSPSGGVNTTLFRPSFLVENNPTFTIGFMSRIEEGKGWRTFLKAVSLVNNSFPEEEKPRIIIIGDGTEKQRMLLEIERLNLSAQVSYKGRLHQHKLPEVISELDVMIFPTLMKESLGLTGIEAMACGVPVIGSKIGGLTDYLVNAENGFFFRPGDYKDLSEKLIAFHKLSPEAKKQMKSCARSTALAFESTLVAFNLCKRLNCITSLD